MFNRNQLDEMQEQKLLHIERNGCWFAFWGLLLALVVEALLGMDMKALAGEWVLFMALAVYLGIACGRAGIWDRRLKMTWQTNLVMSLIGGLCTGLFMLAFISLRYGFFPAAAYFALFIFLITVAILFVSLQLSAASVKKRQQQRKQEPEEE